LHGLSLHIQDRQSAAILAAKLALQFGCHDPRRTIGLIVMPFSLSSAA
jgi:hypothetical protein